MVREFWNSQCVDNKDCCFIRLRVYWLMQVFFPKRRYIYAKLQEVTSYGRQNFSRLNDFSIITFLSAKGSNVIEMSSSQRPTEPSLTTQVYPSLSPQK